MLAQPASPTVPDLCEKQVSSFIHPKLFPTNTLHRGLCFVFLSGLSLPFQTRPPQLCNSPLSSRLDGAARVTGNIQTGEQPGFPSTREADTPKLSARSQFHSGPLSPVQNLLVVLSLQWPGDIVLGWESLYLILVLPLDKILNSKKTWPPRGSLSLQGSFVVAVLVVAFCFDFSSWPFAVEQKPLRTEESLRSP